MRVTYPEQRPFDLHGKVQSRARPELSGVHVAADAARRDDAVETGRCRRHADHAAERLDRDADPVGEDRLTAFDLPDMEPWALETVRQQPEARYERRPPVGAGLNCQDVDLEDVTGPRTLDEHRAADGIDEIEVERSHRAVVRARTELAARGVHRLDRHLSPGNHRQDRRMIPAPAVVHLCPGQVKRRHSHGENPDTRRAVGPAGADPLKRER